MPTIKHCLQDLSSVLQCVTESPRLEAELLLQLVLERQRVWLYAHPEHELDEAQYDALEQLKARRCSGEPMAYIQGEKEFFSLLFYVTSDVLIPRPATESLVEWVLERFQNETLRVLDLGTGSGAIAVALAKHRPDWKITAIDISKSALAVAESNVKRHDVNQVELIHGDWFSGLASRDFDLIISNPPYIAEDDPHLSQLCFEPRSALVAADDGLSCLNELLQKGSMFLSRGGKMVIEHGYNQSQQLIETAHQCNWKRVDSYCDLAQCERFIVVGT